MPSSNSYSLGRLRTCPLSWWFQLHFGGCCQPCSFGMITSYSDSSYYSSASYLCSMFRFQASNHWFPNSKSCSYSDFGKGSWNYLGIVNWGFRRWFWSEWVVVGRIVAESAPLISQYHLRTFCIYSTEKGYRHRSKPSCQENRTATAQLATWKLATWKVAVMMPHDFTSKSKIWYVQIT